MGVFFPQSTCQAQQSQQQIHSAANVISRCSVMNFWLLQEALFRCYHHAEQAVYSYSYFKQTSVPAAKCGTWHFPWWFSFQKSLHGNGLHKSECLLQQSSGKSKQTMLYELKVGLIMRVLRHAATARNGCGKLKQKILLYSLIWFIGHMRSLSWGTEHVTRIYLSRLSCLGKSRTVGGVHHSLWLDCI